MTSPVGTARVLGERVLAHGIGGRQDLPIPFSYALAGSAIALVVSFVALGALWRRPLLEGQMAGRPLPEPMARVLDARSTRLVLRLLGLSVAGYLLAAAVFGRDDALNPTAGAVFVLFWVGVVPVSVLLGPVWRLVNPLRSLHLAVARLLGTDPARGLLPLPRRLGFWPAVVGLFAFVWLELVAPDRATLPVIRTWFALYAAAHLLGASLFGSRWFDRGDAFEAYSSVFGRLSVLGRRGDGRLVVRNPLDGIAGLLPAPGLVALVAVMLGSTGYDSGSNATFWIRWVQDSDHPVLLSTAGLLCVIAAVAVALSGAARLAGALTHGDRRTLPGEFAHSIVPIALGYVVAHYYSLLVIGGQQTLINLSDPLGTGADWLGTAGRGVDYSLVTPTTVATLQVVAVVAGHILGVVLAHDRAVRLFPRREAIAGQLPLLVLMVGYTLGGLTLLFST